MAMLLVLMVFTFLNLLDMLEFLVFGWHQLQNFEYQTSLTGVSLS